MDGDPRSIRLRALSGTYARVCLLSLALIGAMSTLGGCAAEPTEDPMEAAMQGLVFWPPYPNEPRIQFLRAYQKSSDVEPARERDVLQDIIYGEDDNLDVLPINKPYGLEMQDGKIYVCDIRNAAVVILDLRKQETRLMGTSGGNALNRPTDIAIADDGMMYVSDRGRNTIFVFGADERYLTMYGHKDLLPVSVAVHEDKLYVVDFQGQCIEIMNRFTGETIRKIGGPGAEDGKFVRPLGIEVDGDGNIWATDVIRCRVQKFSPEGELLQAYGFISDSTAGFVRPKHLVVDDDGRVMVVDSSFQNVQVFNAHGQLLTFFGSSGSHPGSMFLPAGICIDDTSLDLFDDLVHPAFEPEYVIAVTNQFGPFRVALYAMGQLREGRTVQDIAGASLIQGDTGLSEEEGGAEGELSQPRPGDPADEPVDQSDPPESPDEEDGAESTPKG